MVGLNKEIVVAMERYKNVKLNDQERQLLVLPWLLLLYVVSLHFIGTTNSACPNLPVVAINITESFICSDEVDLLYSR